MKKCQELGENLPVVDPNPDQPYLRRAKASCVVCSKQQQSQESQQLLTNTDTLSWSQDTGDIPKMFTFVDILNYSKKSGKNYYVEKPIDRGYAFFHDGYVHNQSVTNNKSIVTVKAKCYRSMKKSEKPHDLLVTLKSDGSVQEGKCSCVAGVGGHCNHIYALLYSIDHTLKLKLKTFPRAKTCTDKPAEWTKCRVDGIQSEPVMKATVVKPKYGSSSKGVKTTLYEARAGCAKGNMTVPNSIQEKLSKINPLFGVGLTTGFQSSDISTQMGLSVPKGSPLSYQLAITEGDFCVIENISISASGLKTQTCTNQIPKFPWSITDIEKVADDILTEIGLDISAEKANEVYEATMEQALSDTWHDVRKKRLTASKFGVIVTRKKDKEKFILNQLLNEVDLSKVPAVLFGRENEDKAVFDYVQYMNNSGRNVSVYRAGCVINPNFPWLAASPDRVVHDSVAGFGLVEVKCSFSKRNVSPKEACMDTAFLCEIVDSTFCLKKDHHYYAQIQGQLGITGAMFCDFVLYTKKGLGIQRIMFDEMYWRTMSSKLRCFFLNDFLPVLRG